MKQVALLIRGHSRNYKKLYDNFFSNFLAFDNSELKITIFIHTWNYIDYNKKILTDIEELKENYKIEANNIIVEDQEDIMTKPIFNPNRNKAKFQFQLWSIYKLGELVTKYESDKNMEFDYYVHTRFDIFYEKNIREILDIISTNELLIFPDKTYADIYAVLTKKVITQYNNMITINYKKIKRKYNSYGVNPIIWDLSGRVTTIKARIGYISRI